jgi:hypothetical protein
LVFSIFLFLFFILFFSRGLDFGGASSSPPSYDSLNGCGSRYNNGLYNTSSLSRMLSRSPEWANVSEKDKEKLGLTLKDDGEFW